MVELEQSSPDLYEAKREDVEFLRRLIDRPTHSVISEEISYALELSRSRDNEVHDLAEQALEAIGYI